MLTIKTDSKIITFNLRTFEKEKELKDIVLNYVIDQKNKEIRIGFRHASNDDRVGNCALNTKDIRRVDFRECKFYNNNKFFLIKIIRKKEEEKSCQT